MSIDESYCIAIEGDVAVRVPRRLSISTAVLLEQERWFEAEFAFARAYVRPGDVVVDVGANLGVYALSIARAIGMSGALHAYEPTPDTAALLEASARDNGLSRLTVVRAAVSARAGEASFFVGDDTELNSLDAPADASRQASAIRVPMVTLDEEASRLGWDRLAFLKVDAEGRELDVLNGAERVLRDLRPAVMFEVRAGDAFEFAAAEHLRSMGFELFRLVPGAGALVPFDHAATPDSFLINIFALAPETVREAAERGVLDARVRGGATPATAGAGIARLRTLPGSRGFLGRWRGGPGLLGGAGIRDHFRALDRYAAAMACPRPDERAAGLLDALSFVRDASSEQPRPERALTHVRIATEAGYRQEAVSALDGLRPHAEEGVWPDLREPFLAPISRFDHLDSTNLAADWLTAAVREAMVRVPHIAACYAGESILPLLEALSRSPFPCAELERARQLVRLITGRQESLHCHPLLAGASAENRNSALWCGG